MSKVVATFECVCCGDVFEATSEDYAECKCGKNSVKPSQYSTSYKRDGDRGNNFNRIKSKTFYFENEYLKLDDECNRIWDKIKNFKFDNYSHFYWVNERKDKSADGNEYIESLRSDVSKASKYNEHDELKFEIGLMYKEHSTKPDLNKIKEKLKQYYKTLIKLKYGKLDLNDRKTMMDYSRSYYKKQQEKYDYEFWI